ncbi:hypothetical protein Asppvi_009304 [Aspergillus pseudoviridinutans]|uniref:Integral membrane protein n=1 Tax=Aspergillus pseudoviridinutans TaxID=1517512 RepID=A0A9P3BFU7_9EURO|nr:uncharacterized protein Asppvi_009304 [Aspergillus pseudoviridinutans]GIJ90350.1 hypothetical protein Asppvi_009304 [Aspergillus pseudoviridinutans]
MSLLAFGLSFSYLYLTGTLVFDTVHWLLHKWSKSQWRFLRWLSYCHQFHHLYYNRSLKFNDRYSRQNSWIALPLEMLCKVLGSVAGWLLARHLMAYSKRTIDTVPLLVVSGFEIIRTVVVIAMGGRDSNHIAFNTVPKDHSWLFVGPEYHALHHVYPERYMGSMVKVFDWVAGTAYSLRNKRVILTGGSGAFGCAIEKQLLSEGVKDIKKLHFGKDWTHHDVSGVGHLLEKSDILILAHGTKGMDAMDANCNSTMRLIEVFLGRKAADNTRQAKTVPEIWYVGSEIEVHPAWGNPEMQRYSASKRAFLPYARALYDDPRVIYRHIVPAAFESRMGKAIVSPDWAARVALWWIRRGAYYVPVTYTGLSFLNFFKFLLLVRPCTKAYRE